MGSFAGRVAFVLIAGILAAIATNVSYWNWYGFPGVYTASYIRSRLLVSFSLELLLRWCCPGAVRLSETHFVQYLDQRLRSRTVNAGRPFRMPYVASAAPSLLLKCRSAPVFDGTHLAPEFAFRNFVISFSERSLPFARE